MNVLSWLRPHDDGLQDAGPGPGDTGDPGAAQLVAILDALPDGVLAFDAALQVRFVNAGLAAMLGIAPDDRAAAGAVSAMLGRSTCLDGAAVRQAVDRCAASFDAPAGTTALSLHADDGTRMINLQVLPLAEGQRIALFEDVTTRLAAEATAIQQAMSDPLTGLLNRRLFQDQVGAALAASQPGDQGAVVMLIDLDRFKAVNDTLGHAVGDTLLCLVAKRLRTILRSNDTIARLGGDEFAVLIARENGQHNLVQLAGRIVDVLGRPYLANGHLVNIGASIGIARATTQEDSYGQLVRNADLALYHAKAAGRSTFSFFEPEMDARATARRTLEIDLRKALSLRQFMLYFQPQIDLRTDTVLGFEALLRWDHPERGLVSPVDFIPLAEEIGLIVPLGEWVLREACRVAAHWPDHVSVGVNVSPLQFEDPVRLVAMVRKALALSGLPGPRLEVEITESVLLRNEGAVLLALHELRGLGVRIAMDDFGTGYSSLSQLRSFPFDKIKIDRSFVKDKGGAGQNAVIRAITALGASLGISTIAEGVETTEQLDWIRAEGCDSVQGYLFSRPIPADQVGTLINDLAPASNPGETHHV